MIRLRFAGIWLVLALLAVLGCHATTANGPGAASTDNGDDAWWRQAASPADDRALRERVHSMVDTVRQRREVYRLGPEDKLRITIWNRPDLSKETRIRPDGVLFVPLVGNIQAAGMTVSELQAYIVQHLGRVLREPQVDIEILEYASKMFYLLGQVMKPGMYPVTATTTVLEAVAIGGGPTEKANLEGSCLLRQGLVVPINFNALFQQGDMSQNLMLADGDVIFLPSIDDAKVFVLGEVNHAMSVPMLHRRMTLSEAIAEAGGFNEITAYKRGIKIIRGGLANPQVFTVNYEDILRGRRPDVAYLRNGDIVFVPAGGLTKWDRVLGQLLPNLSRIVVDAAAVDSLTHGR